MAPSNHDPTARQNVLDEVDISDLRWTSLDVAIRRLTELRDWGYTDFDASPTEKFGDPCVSLTVTKRRLENDEEYEERMKQAKFFEKREYEQFLKLKKKFEDPTKPF